MERAVIDTNVLVSALISHNGNPAHILDMISDGSLTPVYCLRIIGEYTQVLSRPHFRFSRSLIIKTLDLFNLYGIAVNPQKSDFFMIDESDRIFYDTAIEGAAILITGNLRHYPVEPFIVNPAEFLRGVI